MNRFVDNADHNTHHQPLDEVGYRLCKVSFSPMFRFT